MSFSVLPNEKPTRTLAEFEYIHNPESKEARLGKGSFASVKLVKEKATGALLAMKTVDVTLKDASKSDLHNLRMEIQVHRDLDHPNIIKFHDYLIEEGRVYMVLDYAPRGNLYSYMHRTKTLPLEQVFKFFYQTCLAIGYLHGKDILHRDIKPENLLLDRDYNIKLCDFGWAARSIKDKRTTFCGTYEYMAPELVAKSTYNYKVDIWSLGILLYELFHSEAPYKGRSLTDIQASMARDTIHYNPVIQPELKDLITCILQKDPELRPELPEILSHPWIRQNLAKMDSNFRFIPGAEVSQPAQQQPQQQPVQSQTQLSRPQSASSKDHKSRGVATSVTTIGDESISELKKLGFTTYHRQMSDNHEMIKDNKESREMRDNREIMMTQARDTKESTNSMYMMAGQKLSVTYSSKDLSKQNSPGYGSPLIERSPAGLTMMSAQKNYSEGHMAAPMQSDSNAKLSKSINLHLGRPAKNGTRGLESDFNVTPEKEQKIQEPFSQLNINRSFLQNKNKMGSDRSLPKENMHAHNLSITGLANSSNGFTSTRHAYTTAHHHTQGSTYDNFSQATSIPYEYKSATKPSNINREFSNGSIREPLSATTKIPSRLEYPSDLQLASSKSSIQGRTKRDSGVKLDVQKFYPFGNNNNNGASNSPAHISFEVNSAGLNNTKSSWGQSKVPLNSSSYVFTRTDSDLKLNYNTSNNTSTTNPNYSPYTNTYNFGQASQGSFKTISSPLVERHMAKEVREGGYKVTRSNTSYMDVRGQGKGSFLG